MTLNEIRTQIDKTDAQMKVLFLKRMQLSAQIAEIKASSGDSVYKPERERQLIEQLTADLDGEMKMVYSEYIRRILELSRTCQYRIIAQKAEASEGAEAAGCAREDSRGEDGILAVFTDPGNGSVLMKALTIISHHGFKAEELTEEKVGHNGQQLCTGQARVWKIRIRTDSQAGTRADRNALLRQLACEAGCAFPC